jgi:hypothetical protein
VLSSSKLRRTSRRICALFLCLYEVFALWERHTTPRAHTNTPPQIKVTALELHRHRIYVRTASDFACQDIVVYQVSPYNFFLLSFYPIPFLSFLQHHMFPNPYIFVISFLFLFEIYYYPIASRIWDAVPHVILCFSQPLASRLVIDWLIDSSIHAATRAAGQTFILTLQPFYISLKVKWIVTYFILSVNRFICCRLLLSRSHSIAYFC